MNSDFKNVFDQPCFQKDSAKIDKLARQCVHTQAKIKQAITKYRQKKKGLCVKICEAASSGCGNLWKKVGVLQGAVRNDVQRALESQREQRAVTYELDRRTGMRTKVPLMSSSNENQLLSSDLAELTESGQTRIEYKLIDAAGDDGHLVAYLCHNGAVYIQNTRIF